MLLIMTNDPNLHWDGSRWLRWSGTEWVDAAAEAAPATYPAPADPTELATGTSMTKARWFWPVVAISGLVILGLVVAVGVAGGQGGSTATSPTSSNAPTTQSPTTEPTVDAAPEPPAPAAPQLTVSQENAIEKAESYLAYTAFSKSGLVQQLKFEGFSSADADFAVANIQVDWNEQADIKAQQYMDQSSFSRSSLISQLKFEGFTAAQAAHGANSVGL